ncbi:MAG: dockerin type I repeat-containing protein [Clostridia bacterium]|nr:dockerin type I repeat-containing protein [Clostridia bacterium]MBR5768599.1 dockerin type I repeat-containing protein [Clostridia bacterium]
MKKRILSVILAFALLLGLLPLTAMTASAASELDNALNVSGGNLKFNSTGTYPWTAVNDGTRYYATSGNAGVASSESVMTLSVSPTSATAVSFEFMAWGETYKSEPCDVCTFYIDNVAQFSYGAYDNNWETYTAPLSAGAHTLKWEYKKDSSADPVLDFFAVDNVKIGIDRYPLYAKGTQVTTANCRDILGDGKLSFDPATYTLTVAGTESGLQAILISELDGLTVKTTTDSTFMNMGTGPAVSLKGNTTFTSAGGRLSLMAMSGNALNFTGSNTTLYFYSAKFYAQGTTGGFVSSGSGNKLNVKASSVSAVAESGNAAVTGFGGGISYSDCSLTTPANAQISNGRINSGGSAAGQVTFSLNNATLYGICTTDFTGSYSDKWVKFESTSSKTITSLGSAPESYGVAYAYGTIYGITNSDDDGNGGGILWTAPFSNPSSYTTVKQVYTGDGTVRSMTYDYTRKLLFLIISVSNSSTLYSLDPSTAVLTEIAALGQNFYGICADENGALYAINSLGMLYSINSRTAELTFVASTGYACKYVQDIAYDFDTGDIYWARVYSTNDGEHGLCRINKATGETFVLDKIGSGGAEIVGMFAVPTNEPGGAQFTKGDMDNDGQITVADALRALRIAAKLSNPTEDDMVRGDVDFDGDITVADALKILRVAARLATPESLQPNR